MASEDDCETAREGEAVVREPLPAGHPIAWSVLVEGTCLEGTVWPGWGACGEPTCGRMAA